MEAFSNHQHHHPFLLDTVFLPTTTTFAASPVTPCFSQFNFPESLQQIPVDVSIYESCCLENDESGTKKVCSSNTLNEASVTNKHTSTGSSSVVNTHESGDQVTHMVNRKRNKYIDGSSTNSVQSMDGREVKGKKAKKCDGGVVKKDEKEKKPRGVGNYKIKKDRKIVSEDKKVPAEYVHVTVRARRGKATDSHSLVERARREKISERMNRLQALVPGCDEVTGKALLLDHIINYVQTLQNQVELLSMKLASANPMFFNSGMDLDAFIITPEGLNGMGSPPWPENGQQWSPEQAASTAFSDTSTAPDNYPLLDNVSTLLFDEQVLQMPNILPQDNGQLLWDVVYQRQKLLNQSAFTSNLCSFH